MDKLVVDTKTAERSAISRWYEWANHHFEYLFTYAKRITASRVHSTDDFSAEYARIFSNFLHGWRRLVNLKPWVDGNRQTMPKVRFLLATLTYANHETCTSVQWQVSDSDDIFNQLRQNLMLTLWFCDHTCTWPDMTQWASWVFRTFVSAIMGLWCNEELCRTESEGKSMYPYPVCAHMPSSHQTHNKSCYLTHNIANQLWWLVKHCPAFSA